jgi:hypothetical protein
MAVKKQLHFYKKAITIPVYGGTFLIIFSNDREKVIKIVNCKEPIIELYAFTFHNFIHKGKETFCVCFNFWEDNKITLGTIMHEVTHAANRLLQSRGFDPDWTNDEAEAYIKGWMGDEIEAFMVGCKIMK